MIKNIILGFCIAIYGHCFAQANALPSCYNSKIVESTKIPSIEMFILIDQTTPLDTQLKQQIADQTRPFLTYGNAINLIVFSSFNQGKYTRVIATARIEHRLADNVRADISKPLLARFDDCMQNQPRYASQVVGAALKFAFDGTNSELARSDIFSSLKEISRMVSASMAPQRIVLIASDMLENSSITSFYQNQAVRLIDPDQELATVVKSEGFAEFSNARVYVIGAGLIPEESKNGKGLYRDPKTMQALSVFWSQYFKKSNGQLVEFGKPSLLNTIR